MRGAIRVFQSTFSWRLRFNLVAKGEKCVCVCSGECVCMRLCVCVCLSLGDGQSQFAHRSPMQSATAAPWVVSEWFGRPLCHLSPPALRLTASPATRHPGPASIRLLSHNQDCFFFFFPDRRFISLSRHWNLFTSAQSCGHFWDTTGSRSPKFNANENVALTTKNEFH